MVFKPFIEEEKGVRYFKPFVQEERGVLYFKPFVQEERGVQYFKPFYLRMHRLFFFLSKGCAFCLIFLLFSKCMISFNLLFKETDAQCLWTF